jgi:hypothetical protein
MMKIRFVALAMTTLLAVGACSQPANKSADPAAKVAENKKYYCTMHPNIQSDKPGTCSKCGMDLVERDTTAK